MTIMILSVAAMLVVSAVGSLLGLVLLKMFDVKDEEDLQ